MRPVVQSQDRRLSDTPYVAVTSCATGGWPVPPLESKGLDCVGRSSACRLSL
jgi:hypothetical protein